MQATTPSQAQRDEPRDVARLNLLYGGGIRGLSALIVLEQLMASINQKAANSPPLKPCDYFDLICGTSTGGIIAIMLGRLRMDVQECIDVYLQMAGQVFSRVHRLPVNLHGHTHGRFNQVALQEAIENVLGRKGLPNMTLLKDDDPYGCKIFVCAKRLKSNELVTFTSFETVRVDRDLLNNATIVQACLATSAAPTYFEPMHMYLGPPGAQIKASFIDGGLGYNNPIGVLWTQVSTIWGSSPGGLVDCLVSLGTGKPRVPDYGTSASDLGQRLLEISGDSEEKANEFYEHHRADLGRNRYFRFNVDRGLEDVDLGEAEQKDRIIEVTKNWLNNGRVFDDMEDCAKSLASREWSPFLPAILRSLCRRCSQPIVSSPSNKDTKLILEGLSWLTDTRVFAAWMTPARGEVICSRWLWYSEPASQKFVQSLDAHFRTIRREVLHFDCSQAASIVSNYDGLLAKFSRDCPLTIVVIIWALVSQALGETTFKNPETSKRALKVLNSVLAEGEDDDRPQEGMLASLLRSALNFKPQREVVLLLHRVDCLEDQDLVRLRNLVQDVMDSLRLPNVAQTRTILTGARSYDAEAALKGIVRVHKNTEYDECVSSLIFKTMNLRRNRIINRDLGETHWLLSNTQFQKWSAEPSGVLWIYGKPGSGKSVLARRICQHMTKNISQTGEPGSEASKIRLMVCDWFFSARDGLTSHHLMLRDMLRQMLSKDASLFEHIVHIYRRAKAKRKADDEWSSPDLEESLTILVKILSNHTTVLWIIDGLDESDIEASGDVEPSRDYLLQCLERLSINFKVLILSRLNVSIAQRLTRSPKIKLEDENGADVQRVVDEGLRSLFKSLDGDTSKDISNSRTSQDAEQHATAASPRSHVHLSHRPRAGKRRAYDARVLEKRSAMLSDFRQYLVDTASGVILWVVTVLAALKNRLARNSSYKAKDLWAELQSFPPELESLYQNIVTGLIEADGETIAMACRALIWVNVATTHRPFQLQELREAMRIPSESDKIDEQDDPFDDINGVDDAPSFLRYVQTICGPFIERVRDRQSNTGSEDEDKSEIQWTDQVQLLHQSAKAFLETSSAAGPFKRSFPDAERLVKEESQRYLHLALPARSTAYAPLPVWESTPHNVAAEEVLEYLDEKALLSFILGVLPAAAEAIPDMYRHLFHSTLGPNVSLEVRYDVRPTSSNFGPDYLHKGSGSGADHNVIVEYFFRCACEAGWNTAIENVFHLGSLRFPTEKWLWYREEVAILHGALIAAIEYRLLPQVQKLAWYIEKRGLDLLDLPDDVRFGRDSKEPFLVKKALTCGNLEIALTVIGYKTTEERNELTEVLRSRSRDGLDLSTSVADPDVHSVREAVETVIGFWKRPDTHDRSGGKLKDTHDAKSTYEPGAKSTFEPNWGPNIGLDLGLDAEGFGANINAETDAYMASQRKMFTAEMQAQKKMQKQTTEEEFARKMKDAAWRTGPRTDGRTAKPSKIRRKDWLSHQDLCRQVAILHGGRNANTVRLQPVDPKVGDPGDGDDGDTPSSPTRYYTAASDKIQ